MDRVKILGKMIKFTGKVTRKFNVYLLGHYLEGTGNFVRLDKKFYPAILDNFLQDITFPLEYIEGKCFINIIKENWELYTSIGKYKVLVGQGYIFVEDFYEFYPWCDDYRHFRGCSCSRKIWGDIKLKVLKTGFLRRMISRILSFSRREISPEEITNTFNKFLSEEISPQEKIKRGNGIRTLLNKSLYSQKRIKIYPFVEVDLDLSGISIRISDEFFEKLGKGFFVLAKIPFHTFQEVNKC